MQIQTYVEAASDDGMQLPKWTIMEWDRLACKFLPWGSKDILPKLHSRQRIPHIDKILQKPVDPRPLHFQKLLKKSLLESQKTLEEWSSDLSIDDLEQFSLAIAASGEGLKSVPPKTLKRLTEHGLRNELRRQIDLMRVSSASLIHKIEAPCCSEFPDTLVMLSHNPTFNPEEIQAALEKHQFIDPRLNLLRSQWSKSLADFGARKLRSGSLKEFELLDRFLPIADQAQVVANELCHLATQALNSPFPASLSSLCRKLGENIEHHLLLNVRKQVSHIELPYIHRRSDYIWGLTGRNAWTVKARMIIGAWWVQSALKSCRFTQVYQGQELSRPAFWNTWFISRPTKRGVIVVNEYLLNLLNSEKAAAPLVNVEQVPSLTIPRPWTSTHATNVAKCSRGLSLIASPSTEGQATVKQSIDTGAALEQLRGVNRLQMQPWRINQAILNILKQSNHESPPDMRSIIRGNSDDKTRRVQLEKATTIATALDTKQFYLPMYMDFRGRCYASNRSILNFMGKEAMRALFIFGDDKQLGEEGLFWLEVHIANLYGQSKSKSFQERRSWVADQRMHIIESAKHPMSCTWWKNSQKPYQTLAACFELHNAWSCSDPKLYKTALPIQIDGTSNGLQHLVALARDEKHAGEVNIASMPDKTCGDVYAATASLLALDIGRDAIKKAVMTFFYGSSTARIAAFLCSENSRLDRDAALEISSKLTSLFEKEKSVQDWLSDCARRIMNSRRADRQFRGAALVWTSPLGLPVVQPYAEPKLMAVRTPLQSFFLPSPLHLAEVVGQKQTAAVVANVVHSLDAAHMLSTASAMPTGCDFAAVHDCFWTHPASVSTLNDTLRQQFYKMHSRDILTDLRDEWLVRYSHYKVLGTVHSDSPFYEELLWKRDGVTGGIKETAFLEKELVNFYAGRDPYAFTAKSSQKHEEIVWEGVKPRIGSKQMPHIKMWFQLELPPPPARGSLDLRDVLNSPYFFS